MRCQITVYYRANGYQRTVDRIGDYASLAGAKRAAMRMIEVYRMDTAYIHTDDGRTFFRVAGEKLWRQDNG